MVLRDYFDDGSGRSPRYYQANAVKRAKTEAGYTASRFLQMLTEHGGVETARRLLPQMSDGFTELWRGGRLDLTVEALVLQSKWDDLFSAEEREAARGRLRECGMDI